MGMGSTHGNAKLHIVDEREYQENCERIIEANTNLQQAINFSRRTPLTPATMTGGLLRTNAASSSFSFYRLDDTFHRKGAANGLIQSRESGRDGFPMLRLGDTVMGGLP